MSQLLAALITSAIGAISGLAAAIISWLNRKAIQSAPIAPVKSGNPPLS